jgi:hypothetical protein
MREVRVRLDLGCLDELCTRVDRLTMSIEQVVEHGDCVTYLEQAAVTTEPRSLAPPETSAKRFQKLDRC